MNMLDVLVSSSLRRALIICIVMHLSQQLAGENSTRFHQIENWKEHLIIKVVFYQREH